MSLLLDTHVWLWGLLEPSRLPPRVRRAIDEAGDDVHLSPISIWETLILLERGRLEIRGDPFDWVDGALRAGPWHEIPLTVEIALASRRLPIPVDDPADRFLVATAAVHRLRLVTADRRLRRIHGVDVLSF